MVVRNEYSAGGIVTDDAGRVAVIRTRSLSGVAVWALPKGHPEPGETGLEAALREASEETGLLVEARSDEPVTRAEYWYTARDGARVRKRVDWFAMAAHGPAEAGPDAVEVEEVAVLPPAEALARLSYRGERQVLGDVLRP